MNVIKTTLYEFIVCKQINYTKPTLYCNIGETVQGISIYMQGIKSIDKSKNIELLVTAIACSCVIHHLIVISTNFVC